MHAACSQASATHRLGMMSQKDARVNNCSLLQAARKVYSTLLASLPGMPQAYVSHAPPMVLAHARAELKQASKDAQQRALHALMWLGSGGSYERFKGQEKGQQPSEPWSSDR